LTASASLVRCAISRRSAKVASMFAIASPVGVDVSTAQSSATSAPAASTAGQYLRRSRTRYATISAAGKKKRLNTKNRKKLCPFRPATRAGQNAIATQMMKNRIPPSHQPRSKRQALPTSAVSSLHRSAANNYVVLTPRLITLLG
jgi:hypothetical protein